MYILASDLFETYDKYVFRARNSCGLGGIFSKVILREVGLLKARANELEALREYLEFQVK